MENTTNNNISKPNLSGLKNIKVLFAEDQKLSRLMTTKLLENNGLIVVEAEDGTGLIEIYKNSLDQSGKSSFDIILTDIYMANMNGDEATIEIRKIEKQNNITKPIPIIALTGNGEKEDIEHFLDCQINEYFLKGDSHPERILEIIARNVWVE